MRSRLSPTHWAVHLTSLRALVGTVVSGNFTCSKNPDNSRELVVEMTWSVQGGETKAQVWKVR